MILTTTHQRKTFRVQAIQITAENMEEISRWCGGKLKTYVPDLKHRPGTYQDGQPCIELLVSRVMGRESVARAYVGDWITRIICGNHFNVYRDKKFRDMFQEIQADLERHEIILGLLAEFVVDHEKALREGADNPFELLGSGFARRVSDLFAFQSEETQHDVIFDLVHKALAKQEVRTHFQREGDKDELAEETTQKIIQYMNQSV